MGAMYQLVPVALETRLFSERLGRWQFVMHVAGVTGMIWTFWIWNLKQAGHWACLVALGVGLFVYNIARTLAQVPRWNVVAAGIASALVWLSLTILAGSYVVAAKCWDFSPFVPMAQMHAHAHLGVAGVFLMMIVAVSYKLVPMFLLSEVQKPRRAAWSVGLLNAGVAAVFVTVLFQSRWKPAAAGLLVAGLTVFGLEMGAIVRARKRAQLDWGIRYFVTALQLLAPVCGIGLVLSWPALPLTQITGQLENVYGFLALVAVVSLAILGMLYKIVPFLVWWARYSREVGRKKVPSFAELYSARLQVVGYWLFLAALAGTTAGALMGHERVTQAGCATLAASLTVFAANMLLILRHFWRRQAVEFPGRPTASLVKP
jgi:hypothetical protein